ncbi:uncharacterized protein LOC121730298 [Aricia agestis]|uniref:uncharacterized protein LOC121730298 n=1 Tax=Aricia agestis TaxID=91739 RepID=UPI001C20592B|nr:uncharacterized protein LOC121730298 [Aricia agestis]XP_041975219.1 uncharacterized protein LOC121730298 [Aricia agestis]
MTLHWWMHWFWVTMLLTILATTRENHAAPHAEVESERQARAMYFTKTQPVVPVTTPRDDANATTTPENVTTPVTWTPVNVTEAPTNATYTKRRNLTRPVFVADDVAAESRIVTEKPLSLETTFLQTRVPDVESSRRVVQAGSVASGGLDAGAIAGISLATLAAATLAASTALVLYRRRYLNKPQTLNDKCSNPDSSGYLDDSTIRDNSEEMYSLDNDSFLNSLEAMTIQNYWTDTVKHTKL